MAAFSKNVVPMDKVCDNCGDVGFAENIATCYICNKNSEHTYCMQNPAVVVPKYWLCEECTTRSNGKSEKRKTILLDAIEAQKAATPIKRCCSFLTYDSKQFNGFRREPPSVRHSSLKIIDASTSKGKGKAPLSCPSLGVLSTPTIPRNISLTAMSRATHGMPVSPASRAPAAHSQGTNRAREPSAAQCVLTTETENIASEAPNAHCLGANRAREPSGILTTQTENTESRTPAAHSWRTNRASEPSVRQSVLTTQTENIGSRTPNAQSPGTNRASEPSVKQGVLTIQTENIRSRAPNAHSWGTNRANEPSVGQAVLTIQTENIGPSSQHNETAENRSSIRFLGNTACVGAQIEINGYQNTNPEPNAPCRGINNASQPSVGQGVLTTQTENIGSRAPNAHSRGTNRASEPSVRQGVLTTQTENIGPSSQHNETAKNHSAVCFLGITARAGAQIEINGYQNTNPEPKLLLTTEGMPPHHPVPNACWTGYFKIFDSTSNLSREIQGIHAHIPSIVSLNVYETMKRLHGQSIELKLLRSLDIWPTLFDLEPPQFGDIGLFFFPSKEQRLKEKFTHLVNMMDKQGLAMKGRLPDAKLLIFTYSQLPSDYDGIVREVCLWGVLRRISPKTQSAPGQVKLAVNSPISGNGKSNGDKNHATGSSSGPRSEGIANARTNGPHAPPGFSEPIYRNQVKRERQSITDSPVLFSRDDVDAPPGFSKPIYRPNRS